MNITFGTDGIRSAFTQENFSIDKLHILGNALALWAQQNTDQPKIIIITDTRWSRDYIKSALLSGLLLHHVVVLDCGVMPTPAAYFLMEHYNAELTIIISASHNPAHDNGIKIIGKQGKLSNKDEQTILAFCAQNKQPTYKHCGTVHYKADEAQQLYCTTIINTFKHLKLNDQKIVLDLAHGALSALAPTIFTQLGAQVTALYQEPNGYNINAECGSTHPHALQHAMHMHRADIGFAFDGDGDRIIFADAQGAIHDGDAILAVLIENNRYKEATTVVGTIMSNSGLEYHLAQKKIALIRTGVGDKYVKAALLDQKSLLGGEQSGHIMLADFQYTGDALVNALVVLETLQQQAIILQEPFKRYPQYQTQIQVTRKHNLQTEPFRSYISSVEEKLARGRIVVRYSGTEPVLRIMVEAEQAEQAQHYAHELSLGLYKLLE